MTKCFLDCVSGKQYFYFVIKTKIDQNWWVWLLVVGLSWDMLDNSSKTKKCFPQLSQWIPGNWLLLWDRKLCFLFTVNLWSISLLHAQFTSFGKRLRSVCCGGNTWKKYQCQANGECSVWGCGLNIPTLYVNKATAFPVHFISSARLWGIFELLWIVLYISSI